MEQKKEISRGTFKLIVWGCIIIGILMMAVFAWLSNFLTQPNAYYIEFMGIGQLLLAFGVGLAYSHSLKIQGVD